MYLKQQFFIAMCLCHVESIRASSAETPGRQTNQRFMCKLYIKQIQNIMKYVVYE